MYKTRTGVAGFNECETRMHILSYTFVRLLNASGVAATLGVIQRQEVRKKVYYYYKTLISRLIETVYSNLSFCK